MAVGESAGSVYVTIDGDAAPLMAAFSKAQTAAAAAGGQVASSFNAGASGADQITAAIERLTVALREESAASDLAMQRNIAMARGFGQIGQGAQSAGFSIRYALLGLKDLAEGRTTFALAEVTNQLVRLGPAALAGGAALGVLAAAFYGPIAAAKDLQKEIDKTADDIDKGLEDELEHIERVNVAIQSLQFGATSGKRLEGIYTRQAADRDLDQVRKLSSEIQLLVSQAGQFKLTDLVPYLGAKDRAAEQKEIIDKQAEQQKLLEDADKKQADVRENQAEVDRGAAQDAGRLSAARISAREQAANREAEIAKSSAELDIAASHQAAEARIASIHDPETAAREAADEEVRIAQERVDRIGSIEKAARDQSISDIRAKAGAESAGRTPNEQGVIQVKAQADIAAARDKFDSDQIAAQSQLQQAQGNRAKLAAEQEKHAAEESGNAWRKFYDQVTKGANEAVDARDRSVAKEIETQARVGEIGARAGGQVADLNVQRQKIALEAEYGTQVSHSREQELTYLRQIAAYDDAANTAKLGGLALDLQIAKAEGDTVRAAEIEARLVEASAKARNDSAAAQAKIATTTAQTSFGATLGQTAQSGAASLASAISRGVLEGGKGLGKDIRQSLAGIGREMLGDVIKKGTEELVIAVTGNTIATNINTLWTEILAAAQALFGFADGTDSAPGGMAVVGERGPEIVNLPRGAQVIPNHKISKYADGTRGFSSTSSVTSSSQSFGDLHFHAHGVNNADQFIDHVMRRLPDKLKSRSSTFSPYSH
jgi:hypothetical protein